jgi:hypothetical protein
MQQTKTITLETARGAGVFEVTQLDGVRSMQLFLRLAKTLGPTLAGLAGGKMSKTEALLLTISSITPEEYEHAQNVLLSRAIVRFPASGEVENSVLPVLGDLFTGQPFELGRLVLFALEANYSDFFAKTAGRATGAQQTQKSQALTTNQG